MAMYASWNPVYGDVCSMHHYVMKLVTCDKSVFSSTNKTNCHDMTEILLKVALNTINQPTKHKCRVR